MLLADILNVTVVVQCPPGTHQMLAIFHHGIQEPEELGAVEVGTQVGGDLGEFVRVGVTLRQVPGQWYRHVLSHHRSSLTSRSTIYKGHEEEGAFADFVESSQ